MSRAPTIRTTIPSRTYGQGRKSNSPHALLLRMSYLELERQRCIQETEQLQARSIRLRARIEQIERENSLLKQMLEAKTEPLAATGRGVASSSLGSAQGSNRARHGLSIRY